MTAGQITGLIALAVLAAAGWLVDASRRWDRFRAGARAAMERDDVDFGERQ